MHQNHIAHTSLHTIVFQIPLLPIVWVCSKFVTVLASLSLSKFLQLIDRGGDLLLGFMFCAGGWGGFSSGTLCGVSPQVVL